MSTRQRWRAETQGRGYFGSHVSRPVTEAVEIAVESGGIESRKEEAMLSPQRWTPVRYKKKFFLPSCSHLTATGGGPLAGEGIQTQNTARRTSKIRVQFAWGAHLELSCGAKKEKECKKGEGQIARDRARESVCGGRRYPKVEGRSSAL